MLIDIMTEPGYYIDCEGNILKVDKIEDILNLTWVQFSGFKDRFHLDRIRLIEESDGLMTKYYKFDKLDELLYI